MPFRWPSVKIACGNALNDTGHTMPDGQDSHCDGVFDVHRASLNPQIKSDLRCFRPTERLRSTSLCARRDEMLQAVGEPRHRRGRLVEALAIQQIRRTLTIESSGPRWKRPLSAQPVSLSTSTRHPLSECPWGTALSSKLVGAAQGDGFLAFTPRGEYQPANVAVRLRLAVRPLDRHGTSTARAWRPDRPCSARVLASGRHCRR